MIDVFTDFFKYKKFNIYYKIFNKDCNTNKGILFLHGKSTHSKYFENIVDFKGAEKYKFFTFDYPGKGQSGGIKGEFDSYKYATNIVKHFIETIVKPNKITSIHIIGESYGAAIGFYLCQEIYDHIKIISLIFIPGIYKVKDYEKIYNIIYLYSFSLFFPNFQHPISKKRMTVEKFTNSKEFQNKLISDKYFNRNASILYLLGLYKFIKFMHKNIKRHNLPLLIFHGSNDSYAGNAVVFNFYNKIPVAKKEIVLLEKCQHWLLGCEKLDVIKEKLGAWVTSC